MEKPNIIFIVIDTLRKDYSKELERKLTKYGFICYDNAIAPSPWTIPSHASMFTGLYPAFHEAHETKKKKAGKVVLQKEELLITNILRDYGYKTYLFSSNPLVTPFFGFEGFDYTFTPSYVLTLSIVSHEERRRLIQYVGKYENLPKWKRRVKTIFDMCLHGELYLASKVIVEQLLNYPYTLFSRLVYNWPVEKGSTKIINQIKKLSVLEPAFIFINFMEVHEPYFPKNKDYEVTINSHLTGQIDYEYVAKWKKRYPQQVVYMSKKIDELFEVLKDKNLFENSLIIVTSDHGQLLGEHKRISHGTFLYDELLRVPLCIKYPQGQGVHHNEHNNDKSKYISLVALKKFIINLIAKNSYPDTLLYSDAVFAESYGINAPIPDTLSQSPLLHDLEKYRIAVYYKDFKAIFNVTDWKFEEISSNDSSIEPTEEVIEHLKKKIVRFLEMKIHQNKIKQTVLERSRARL